MKRLAVRLGTLLCLLSLAAGPAHAAPVRLPAVPESADLGWVRQPFIESLPPWDLDPIVFPPASRAMPPKPPEPAQAAWNLLAQADARRAQAEGKGNDGFLHEDAARLYLRAYAADKLGPTGFLALRLAARSYFVGHRYTEAAGVATTLVKRSGGGGAELPFYLLKGEALYQKRDLLAARECFRRALAGRFDAPVRMRIELRVADASLELGNLAYAEPAYRKVLDRASVQRELPYPAIRYADSLLAANKIDDGAAVFGNLDVDAVAPPARAMALIGAGDAALLSGNLGSARAAYMRAGACGDFPGTADWLKLRLADLEFANGNRQAALKEYGALAGSAHRPVAREAGYKKALTMYLLGDHAAVLKESEGWLVRNAGKSGEKGMRAMAAKAGADMVRAAARSNPSERWPALSALLFAYGRTREWPVLLGEIGKEWEEARIWGGAADLYAVAGDAARSGAMRRIGRAEAAYFRGEYPAVLTELEWKDPARESAPGALWLAAKTFYRQGRHAEADAALRRLEAVQAAPAGSGAFPPPRELSVFNRVEQGRWPELHESLKALPPQPQVPGLSMIKAMAEPKKPADAEPETKAGARKGKAAAPSGGDLYADYLRVRERVRKIHAEDGTP